MSVSRDTCPNFKCPSLEIKRKLCDWLSTIYSMGFAFESWTQALTIFVTYGAVHCGGSGAYADGDKEGEFVDIITFVTAHKHYQRRREVANGS